MRATDIQTHHWGSRAPRVMFIHGLGEGSFVWNHIVPKLLPGGSAVAVDLRGHGGSAHDPAGVYTVESHVVDVSAALRRHCPEPLILIGHSLGAEVLLYLANLHAEMVRGVVLVDGGPQLNAQSMAYLRREFAGQPWHYASVDAFARQLRKKFPMADESLLQSLAGAALLEADEGGFRLRCDRALAGTQDRTDDEMMWNQLRSIKRPVLIVRGAASAILPHSTAIRMTREAPRCVLETVPLAGHSVMIDNPAGFIAALRGFISSVD